MSGHLKRAAPKPARDVAIRRQPTSRASGALDTAAKNKKVGERQCNETL
jgi:hypothetical protein